MLTQERLKELLNYNYETGVFVRKISTSSRVKVGDVAGGSNNKGYLKIRVDGKKYLAHRLAWLYVYGEFPENELDHLDGNKLNNGIRNLRECTHAENMQNQVSAKNSSSKFLGVCWSKRHNKWRADIKLNGKQKYLGLFATEDTAYFAYCEAKKQIHQFQQIPR